VRADVVPERFVAESLLDAFPAPEAGSDRVLLARAEQARDVLPEGLAERGYAVDVLPVYRTVRAEPDPRHLTQVREGRVDAITFTSSSTVTNFCDVVGDLPDPQPLVVSIGPITSATARDRGLRVDAEADPHTIDGLVAVLLETVSTG
jgi:uroporphyrinogen-III synthase